MLGQILERWLEVIAGRLQVKKFEGSHQPHQNGDVGIAISSCPKIKMADEADIIEFSDFPSDTLDGIITYYSSGDCN